VNVVICALRLTDYYPFICSTSRSYKQTVHYYNLESAASQVMSYYWEYNDTSLFVVRLAHILDVGYYPVLLCYDKSRIQFT